MFQHLPQEADRQIVDPQGAAHAVPLEARRRVREHRESLAWLRSRSNYAGCSRKVNASMATAASSTMVPAHQAVHQGARATPRESLLHLSPLARHADDEWSVSSGSKVTAETIPANFAMIRTQHHESGRAGGHLATNRGLDRSALFEALRCPPSGLRALKEQGVPLVRCRA